VNDKKHKIKRVKYAVQVGETKQPEGGDKHAE